MMDDKEILTQWCEHKKKSDAGMSLQYRNNLENMAFYAGDMMTYRGEVRQGSARMMVQFNKVRPYIDGVVGFMAQNRRKGKYIARVPEQEAQEAYSKYSNGIASYVRANANADQVETAQDRDMLVCGYGVTDTDITYGVAGATRDPNGEVLIERWSPNRVGWDPNAKAPGLMDARWVYGDVQYHYKEAEELFGKEFVSQAETDDALQDTTAQYYPFGGEYDKIGYEFADGSKELINVYKYQWFEVEDYWRAKNPLKQLPEEIAAQVLELLMGVRDKRAEVTDEYSVEDIFAFDPAADYWIMTTQVKNDVGVVCKDWFIEFEPMEGKRRCYYTAILSGQKVFKKYKSPDQHGFTMKFKTAVFDEVNKCWYGMVSSLKEPALYYNKGLTELMYIIAANSKGGVMVEKGAVEDIDLFEKQWSKTNAVLETEEGAVSGGKIAPKAAPALPNGLETVIGLSDAALPQVVGFDLNSLSSNENRNETAMLHRQRVRQVMSTLACYFDSIWLYQKEHARMLLTYLKILAENSQGRLFRIIGEEGATVYEQLHIDGFTEEYDVDIEEGLTDQNHKDMVASMMIEIATANMQFGLNLWPVAFKYLPIDKSDLQQLLQIVSPQPDPAAQQMKQMMEQLQFETGKAELAKKIADGQYATAGVKERQASAMKTFSEGQQVDLENKAIVTHPDIAPAISI